MTTHTPDRVQVILSINFNHDGSAVLLVDGQVAGYVCTERFSRQKKHPGLREVDLDELLAQAGLGLEDVDHVILCNLHNMDTPDIPRLHGSDLKETWLPFWLSGLYDTVRIRDHSIPCTVNPDHHLIHAAVAYYTSPFDTGVSLAIDPLGCRAFAGKDGRLFPLQRGYDRWFNANIGYSHVADELFGSTITGAGKVMGLAPLGRPASEVRIDPQQVADYAQLVELASIDPVCVQVGDKSLNATLAYFIQLGLEVQLSAVLDDLAAVAQRNGLGPNLCMSGGTALNAVATDMCFGRSAFERLHLHPACGDDGTSIGAAFWYWHHVLGRPRRVHSNADLMYSRRRYTDDDVAAALHPHREHLRIVRSSDYVAVAAQAIASGSVVAWFDGASEVGPRALGHRSILADPRDPGMQDRINTRIKRREHFRPFAPSVLNEHAADWFGLSDSPFMLRACPVLRPGVPAITHVDGTSRIQTVSRGDNPAYYDLIQCFQELTGVPMLLNTSFNAGPEPIVETPADAVRTLLNTEIDQLVFPGVLVTKQKAG